MFNNNRQQKSPLNNGSLVPVIAGLVVGISFVVLFFVMLKPNSMLTDEELVSKYSKLNGIKYFLERYPDAKIEVDREPDGEPSMISFSKEKEMYPPSSFDAGIYSITISLRTQPYDSELYISCGFGGISKAGVLENIEQIDSLERLCLESQQRDN